MCGLLFDYFLKTQINIVNIKSWTAVWINSFAHLAM